MILDDLFTFASQNYVANEFDVLVMASVTTNLHKVALCEDWYAAPVWRGHFRV